MGRHNYSENTLPVYTLYLSKNSDCLGASSFPIFSFFCFGINYMKQPRERDLTHRMKCGNMCVGTSAGKHNEFSTMLVLDSNLFLMT